MNLSVMTIRLSFVICLVFCWFVFPVHLHAEESPRSPVEIAEGLRQHLSELTSLSFNFSQRTRGQLSGRSQQASGQALFAKDSGKAKMRWDYQTPERQVIISDGEELLMYFENLNQMIIAPADSLQQDVTYTFFTGDGAVEEDFIISEGLEINTADQDEFNFEVIKLTPKSPTSQVKNVRLWIIDSTQIKRIEIRDNFDTLTLLNVSNIEENLLTENDNLQTTSLFRFEPPEGTEIIRQ